MRALLFFFLLLFTFNANAATFYVRADGSATKVNAIGPASDAAACMSLTAFNAETFAAGDVVLFSGSGGDYTTVSTNSSIVSSMHVVSSGAAGNPIIYSGITNDIPLFDLSGTNVGRCITASSKDYVVISNMEAKGSGAQGAVTFIGTSGSAGSGYTITVTNVTVLSNVNDGFDSGESSGNSCQILFVNCNAYNCTDGGTLSHQGLSAHELSKAIWIGGTMTNCNYFYSGTATTEAVIYGASLTDCVIQGFELLGTTSTVTVDNSSITTSTGRLLGISSAQGIMTITNCTITSNSGGDMLLNGALRMYDSIVTWNANNRIRPYGAASSLLISGNVFDIIDCNGYLFNAVSTDPGTFNLVNNTVSASATDGFCNIGASSGNSVIAYNIFNDCNSAPIFNFVSGVTGSHLVANNTFYQPSVKGIAVRIQGAVSGGAVSIKNNIFVSLAAPIGAEAYAIVSNNCYFDTTDEGGTGSITSDPRLVSPGTDFRLLVQSPCINAGVDVGLTKDFYGRWIVGLPDIGAVEYVAGPIVHMIRMVPTN